MTTFHSSRMEMTEKRRDNRLPQELLDALAHKLMSVNPEDRETGEDKDLSACSSMLGTLPLNFMMVSQRCRDSVLNEFAAMRGLDIGVHRDHPSCDASFFRKSEPHFRRLRFGSSSSHEKDRESEAIYQGPFNTSPWFLAYLMHHGKLGVERVKFCSVFIERLLHREECNEAEEMQLLGARPIDVFANLLGIGEYSRSQHDDLMLDQLEVNYLRFPTVRLETFFALDARELVLTMVADDGGGWRQLPSNYASCDETMLRPVVAPHTRLVSITVSCSFIRAALHQTPLQFAEESWMALLDYVLRTCPRLSQLRLQFTVSSPTTTSALDYLYYAVMAVHDSLFPKLMQQAGVESGATVSIEFRTAIHTGELKLLPMASHPLLKLGEARLSRDSRGRSLASGEVERFLTVPHVVDNAPALHADFDDRMSMVSVSGSPGCRHWRVSFHLGKLGFGGR